MNKFNQMKNILANSKGKKLTAATLSVAVLGSTSAHAALPTEVTGAFTTLLADFDALIALAWPYAIAVTVAWVLISTFKKAAGKASK